MEEVLFSSDSTYAALFTVKYFLLQKLIVKELAYIAVVPSKLDSARLTLRFDL
jgi:hypothetical protein